MECMLISYFNCVCFSYSLFPLLLLLDAAVNCRSSSKELQEKSYKVSDKVAEGVVQCLEQLLRKCYLGSVDQVVVLIASQLFTYRYMI